MSRVNLVHRRHLPDIQRYFKMTGWTILEPKCPWEVFRANRLDHKNPIVVYRKSSSNYLMINQRDYRIFEKFLQWIKSEKEKEN